MEESATRRKRINRLKKMILGGVMMAVLIPVTASIILSVRVHQLSDRIRQQEAVIQELEDENKNLAGAFLTETIEESERNCEKTLQTGKQSAILHKDDMILLEEWAAKPTLLYNV